MGDGRGSASRALVRRPGAVGVWAGDASGLAVVRDGEIGPRRRSPPGTPPGTLAPMFRVWGKRRLGGVSGADTRGSRKAWDHPDNSGSILFRTQCSGSRWAPGGHSVTSAHPGVEGKLFRATRPLLVKAMGW